MMRRLLGRRSSAAAHGAPPAPALWQRSMHTSDLGEVMAIETAAYAFPWTHGNFVDSLAAGYLAWVRHDAQRQLLAYCVAQPGFEETHLLNITVAPAAQRQGHGRALLLALIDWTRARGDAALWLEVRPSNLAGRQLYAATGFEEVGRRRGYYPAEGGQREDALVMRLDLLRPPGHALD